MRRGGLGAAGAGGESAVVFCVTFGVSLFFYLLFALLRARLPCHQAAASLLNIGFLKNQ